MDLGLAGRAVLVTGGSGGIGRTIALAYAREGARVALTYATNEEAAQATVADVAAAGGEGLAIRMDFADPATIEAGVGEAAKRLGGLDVLIANARYRASEREAPLAEVDFGEWTEAVRISVEGTALTIRAALPALTQSQAGRVVLLSSGVAHSGLPGRTAYAAAKAALEGLVASLKWEVGSAGVLVNIVSPGFTLTEDNRRIMPERAIEALQQRTPSTRLSVPEDIAGPVVFLGSAANTNVNGVYLAVSGGMGG